MSSFQDKEGVVILLDSLGTKGIWKSRNPEEVLVSWQGVIDSTNVDVLACRDNGIDLKFNAFSDTMIITLTGDDKEKILEEAGTTLNSIISVGIPHGINFRGCISMGKIYRSEIMVLGDAIDEAAEYYEKSNWVGAFATPSVSNCLDSISSTSIWNSFTKYDVPFHDDKSKGTEKPFPTWAVILTDRIAGNLENNHLSTIIPPRITASSGSIAKKWQNTLDFLNHTEKLKKGL